MKRPGFYIWPIATIAAIIFAPLTSKAEQYMRGFRPTLRKGEPQTRSALVIGNAKYKRSPLQNPVNDARAVAKVLKDALGFDYVKKIENTKTSQLGRAIQRFTERMRKKGGLAVVYYSGHGMELSGENYLIPVDLDARIEADIEYGGGFKLNRLLHSLKRANGPNIIILDACRDNPFRSFVKSTKGGLASTDAPVGSLIAYAAAPGKQAADGGRGLGPFTEALLRYLPKRGVEIEKVLKSARADVVMVTKSSSHPQVPWSASSLIGDIFLGGAPTTSRQIVQPQPKPIKAPKGMVAVPRGKFFMGCNEKVDKECDDDEKPGKTVSVKAFFIDRTEVTVEAYAECVKAGECSKPDTGTWCNWGKRGRKKHPINCVNWNQASKFCAWKGKRLPTEAEWEKAARGTDGRKYPWGNQRASCRYAVFDDERTKDTAGDETDGCGRDSTWPVGSKPAGKSPYGALDMVGNVYEWTDSWWDESERKYRVIRGGSWYDRPAYARASNRGGFPPDYRSNDGGFRCLSDHSES